MNKLGEFVRELSRRRRMFVLDDSYMTTVAYVCGVDDGGDEPLLPEFQEWVSRRLYGKVLPLYWSSLVAATVDPAVLDGGAKVADMSAEQQLQAIDALLRLLSEFLTTRPQQAD